MQKPGLHPKDTSYFECHGTGTSVGDPIEVAAIGGIFAADRTAEKPLLLGAFKAKYWTRRGIIWNFERSESRYESGEGADTGYNRCAEIESSA